MLGAPGGGILGWSIDHWQDRRSHDAGDDSGAGTGPRSGAQWSRRGTLVVRQPGGHQGDGGGHGGQMTILEITEGPNAKGPLHVHHTEDEGFWILEGSATFEVGDQTIEARAGDYVFGPRDIPHRYSTGPDGCRMLFIFTPGGFEELLLATSRPADSRTLPPAGDDTPPSDEEMQRMQAAIRAHGCELLE